MLECNEQKTEAADWLELKPDILWWLRKKHDKNLKILDWKLNAKAHKMCDPISTC